MAILEGIAMAGTSEAFKLSISELYGFIKKKSSKFQKIDLDISNAYRNAILVEKVKTIWQVDKSVNLNNFYYPSQLMVNEESIPIHSLAELPNEIKCVIQGTAGQGKSIFLRYLTGKELREGDRIPLFIELRKISSKKSIEDLILNALSDIGIIVDVHQLHIVLSSGRISLILDAFDEIPEPQIKDTITFIESISSKYHHLQIVISSRPNSEIQKSNIFDVYKLAEIGPSDFKPMLEKFFDGDKEVIDEIVNSIHKSNSNISDLITTPLLLTLFTITYKGYNKIPETPHEFYEDLFSLLVQRHDSTKPGFIRNYSSRLNENQLETLFHAFCFYCMLKQRVSLTRNEAIEQVTLASDAVEIVPYCESNFIKDCVKNTCLIIEEGTSYHFIHKSIREYHSARYIKDADIELKKKFYHSCIEHYDKYDEELKYLEYIDPIFFKNLFVIPAMKATLDYFNWDGNKASAEGNFGKDFKIDFDMSDKSKPIMRGCSITSVTCVSGYFDVIDHIVRKANKYIFNDDFSLDTDFSNANKRTLYGLNIYEVPAKSNPVFMKMVTKIVTDYCADLSKKFDELNQSALSRQKSIKSLQF